MPDDRYAPPEAPLVDESALVGAGGGEFEVGRSLSDGWNATWANFPLWLGVFGVGWILMFLSFFIPPVLGLFLITPVLGWGMVLFTLNMMDRKAEFSDLFAGFSRYGTALISMLVLSIAFLLISLLGQSVQLIGQVMGSAGIETIGFFVNIGWSLFVTSRLYFAPFFIVDQELSAVEALQASWEATAEQKLKTAGLLLLGIALMFAGMLVLLIGMIPAIVLFYLMWASAYRQMVGRSPARDQGAWTAS